jgi:glycerophosphoryl diester phosphodiesterase
MHIRWFAAAVIALAACAGRASLPVDRVHLLAGQLALQFGQDRPVLVIAHRGCWKNNAPENSLGAFRACVAMGVDVVELDVRRTADGVLVVMHDATVDRTTNARGRVADMTAAQIAALRLREGSGGRDAPLTHESPPTFEAAMLALRGRILVNLDAKADVYADAFAVLERTGTTGQIIMKRNVHAGDAPLLQEAPFDNVFAMPIVADRNGAAAAMLHSQLKIAPPAVELAFSDVAYLTGAAPIIQRVGSRIWVNTMAPRHAAGLLDAQAVVHPDVVWGRLIDAGVSMIQTDEPQALRDYLVRIDRRPPGLF